MTPIPATSAWRYTHCIPDGTISYQYETSKPKNCNHPDYVQMFTLGQVNRYGQACFEEGVSSVHTPDRPDKDVMQQALDALLGYKPNSLTHAKEQGSAIIALRDAIAQPVQPSRDHRGEIIDVLCDDVFGEKYESPQTAQPVQPSQYGSEELQALILVNLMQRQARELSDAEIVGIAETACAAGKLCWLGFNKDEDGRYTVPALSPSDFKLVRAVVAAINTKGTTS